MRCKTEVKGSAKTGPPHCLKFYYGSVMGTTPRMCALIVGHKENINELQCSKEGNVNFLYSSLPVGHVGSG